MNAMWTREEYDELRMSNKFKEGIKEGKQEAKIEMISKYMAKHNVSLDTALDDLDIPCEEWEQYKKLIK